MKKTLHIILLSLLLAVASPLCAIAGIDASGDLSSAPQATVSVVHGGVEVGNTADADADLTIYAITGQMVKHLRIHGGHTETVELPSGCYIVRLNGLSRRVVIR